MMDTATAARAVAGRMVGANVRFSRVTTDTRALAAGDLFVALKGEHFDGHDFVATAFERGAAAALVAEPRAAALPGNLIAVAARHADRIVVTSDNPRAEDPAAIAMAIVDGIRAAGSGRWTLELDRAAAIRLAVANAKHGDVVLIAGKGHEDYQETNGVRAPFSDAEVAAAALAEWGAA